MRPIQLKMSAFGPYSGVEEVDFTKFYSSTLFLIAGDTGAGKSTIFNAIFYALYGESVGRKGEKRSPNSYRSDYASATRQTFVELEFEHGGKCYIIRRAPEYLRPKKRGEGTVLVQPEVYFCQKGDVTVYTKTGEVQQKIVQLLGLSADQFLQTVMIAQNDFMQILLASSEKRKQLFQRVFKTDLYAKLQELLKQDYSLSQQQLRQIKGEMAYHIQGIQCSLLPLTIAQCTPQQIAEMPVTTVCNMLNEYIQGAQKQQGMLNKKLTDYQKKRDTLLAQEQHIKQICLWKQQLQQAQQQWKILQQQSEQYALLRKRLTLAAAAQPISNTYELLLSAEKKQKTADAQLKTSMQQLEQLKQQQLSMQQLLGKGEQAQKEATDIKVQLIQLKDTEQQLAQIQQIEQDAIKVQKNYLAAEEKMTSAAEEYRQKFALFCRGQAGILAADLQNGAPCPVCGSVVHPQKAHIEENIPTQAQVQKAEKQRGICEQELRRCSKEYADITGKLDQLKQGLKGVLIDIDQVQKKIAQLKDDQTNCEKTATLCRQQWEKYQKDTEGCAARCQIANQVMEQCNKEYTQLKQEFEKKCREAGFLAADSFLYAYITFDQQQKMQRQLDGYLRDCADQQQKIQLYKSQIGQEQIPTLEQIRQEILELEDVGGKLQNELTGIQQEISANTRIYDNLQKLQQQYTQHMQRYDMLSSLYTSMSGQRAGTVKISFETYIQQYYFQQVVSAANIRLAMLTRDAFLLRCNTAGKNKVSQSGLDLEVLDRQTGKWRDVNTLSGGESFMASLALALGLSDVVQALSGGVKMDCMFVDEGFGTLDDMALQQAVNMLYRLADNRRLVGIISHVEQLQNRIEDKITVTKDMTGSHIQIESRL